jgi:hypothetical protein
MISAIGNDGPNYGTLNNPAGKNIFKIQFKSSIYPIDPPLADLQTKIFQNAI